MPLIPRFVVHYQGFVPDMPKRVYNDVQREAFRGMGVKWHRDYLMTHFTHAGATEYGYRPRQGDRQSPTDRSFRRTYTGRKLRRYGHTYPLVLTGLSRAQARTRDVRATRTGVRVVLHMPPYFSFYRRLHGGTNMYEELSTISEPERLALIAEFDRGMDEGLDRVSYSRRAQVAVAAAGL